MKAIYGINRVRRFRGPVVALGVFDGVHIAHRRILREAVRQAKAIKGTSVVVTFWPHPQKEESLYSLEHRLKLIAELGIDVCIVIKFNYKFSEVTAEDFIRNVLIKRMGANYIYVGKNFRFGKGTKGDFKLLKILSDIHNFKLRLFEVIKINHRSVSSTYIRRLIKKGDIKKAEKLLGRRVAVLGTVTKGASLARRLGFPTANIDPHHEVLPPSGVYAVEVIFNKRKFPGVCSIGSKPTFSLESTQHIEVHIFNFKKNIYGRHLEIQFIYKIRKQKKFSSPLALAEQIKKDIILAKAIFPPTNPTTIYAP
jgi:riboflavin kinase/FMN adenylyltransferase